MIVDLVSRLQRYAPLHCGFDRAQKVLGEMFQQTPEDGRYEIEGERLFVIVSRAAGKGRELAELEYHRRYIDIQAVLAGHDVIGYRPLEQCRQNSQLFDNQKDLGFLPDRPDTWIKVPTGSFAIFFPEDAHAPLAATGSVTKAVVKVAAQW